MKNGRPRIKVPFDTFDMIVEFSSITLILLMWTYTIITFSDLPETIPTHFNSHGEADDWGSKWTIWIIPFIGSILYTGLFVINKFPHLHNYMVNITEENALKNYKFSTRIVRVINFLCALLMAYITYKIIVGAKGEYVSMGSWFFPVIIGTSIIGPIILIIYMQRLNKN